MSEETTSVDTENPGAGAGGSTDAALDRQIENLKKAHAKQQQSQGEGTGEEEKKVEQQQSASDDEDTSKITVDRQYITSLREEAKDYRKRQEQQKDEVTKYQSALKQHFGVDSITALTDKLNEEQKQKEAEEEKKLSRVELEAKKRAEIQKEYEQAKFGWEQRERELTLQRDETIIRNALINAAVANDVVNPKQLLRLLQHEFYVDPNRLVPLYKAEDGEMSLEERVKVFLEDPDNWNLVRSQATIHGSGTKASGSGPARPVFTKAELREMRATRPKEYKDRQDEIMRAYKEGRVK
jgi:hypothetical protein